MRHLALSTAFLLLLAACGGGGGGADVPPSPTVIPITSNDVAPLSPTYRAVFDTEVTVRVSGQALPFTLGGSLTIENEGLPVAYPLDDAIEAQSLKNTLLLQIPANLRLLLEQAASSQLGQDVTIPSQVTRVAREYIHVDAGGRWFSVGGDVENPTADVEPTPVYRTWWASPMLEQEATMFAGQSLSNPATNVLADDLQTVIGTRANQRDVEDASVELNVLGRRYEALVAQLTESLASTDPQGGVAIVSYTRWERPDLGLLRLHAEGLEVTVPTQGGDVTIRLETLDARIVSLD